MPAPQYVLRSYGGGAEVAQLAAPIEAGDLSFTINNTIGWVENSGDPLGTVGPFTVVIDRFTDSVEKILCSSVDVDTGALQVYVDMSDGWTGRGYDGTTPQAHAPGASSTGVQTCWSSAEAEEANQAVFDVLGGGSSSLVGVPIGSSVPFNGTPLTIPANFLLEDGSAVSRTTYSALFTAMIIATTGTSTLAGATITNIPANVTNHVNTGMQVTLSASAGAIYTVQSITSTTIVLTSGVGITAGTNQPLIVYPCGAGDGTTTFNLPESRGRTKIGRSLVATNAQPDIWVGQGVGTQTVTISTSNMPSHNHGGATGNPSVNHAHNLPNLAIHDGASTVGLTTSFSSGQGITVAGGLTTGPDSPVHTHSISNQGSGTALNVTSPGIGCTWIIRAL